MGWALSCVGEIVSEVTMTARQKPKPKQQEANLGQKEARQQERTDAALSRMGENSQESSSERKNEDDANERR
jgi:hypothetical protein